MNLTSLDFSAALLDSIPASVLVVNTAHSSDQLRIESANKQAASTLGVPLEQLIGCFLNECLPACAHKEFTHSLNEVNEANEPYKFQICHASPTGEQWFEISASRLNASQYMLVLWDVTEQYKKHQKLASVIETAKTGLIVYEAMRDKSGHIVDFCTVICNSAAAEMTLQSKQDLLSRTLIERYPDAQDHALFQQFKVITENGETHHQLQYIEPKDRWYELTLAKFNDGFISSFEDVTEVQRANRQLTDRTRLLEGILNTAQIGITHMKAIRDEQGQVVDFRFDLLNRTALDQSRFLPAQVGRTLKEMYPNTTTKGMFYQYVRICDGGESIRTEHYYPDLDRWMDLSVTQFDDGVVVAYTPVTEAKQLEIQLRGQAQLLDNVLNSSLTGIVLVDSVRDSDGKIVDFELRLANRAFAQVARRTPEELVGLRILTIHPHLRDTALFDRYVEVVETGVSQQFEQVMPTRRGIDIWLSVSIVKQGDGLVISLLDVSQLKQVQHQLEASVQQLKRSNESLEQYAYVASHDLQEPLRKIQSFTDVLLDRYGHSMDAGALDLFDRLRTSAARMQLLIRDLLTYSRLIRKPEATNTVALDEVLKGVLSDLEETIRASGASVNIAPLPKVAGNALQLRQLFQNLLSNAIKFTIPGETPRVEVSAQIVEQSQLPQPVAASKGQRWVAVQVKDYGIGFDERYRERIFQVFQRLHGRHTYAGTGIGLAIVQKVVENHGGQITAQSQPGEGATFIVYLPVER